MSKLEQAARQAFEAIGDCSPNKALVKAAYALRDALAGTDNWTPPNYTDEQWQKLDQEYQNHVAEQALREALAEQVHTPYCKQAPMCKTPCGNPDCVEQAEHEPVAIIEKEAGFETEVYATGHADSLPDGVFKLYAAPVRTKDLTDDEIEAIMVEQGDLRTTAFARAVIEKFKEKNNANNNS